MRHNRNNVLKLFDEQLKLREEALIEQFSVNGMNKVLLLAAQQVTKGIHDNNLKGLYHMNRQITRSMEF